MDKDLLDSLSSLKKSLENDPRVIALNEVESRLNSNEEVMKLSYKKDMAFLSYEDSVKHFGENAKETLLKQKELYEAKLALDKHPLVKEYNKKYAKVRKMYEMINKELFEDFSSKKMCR